jgi:streptomycin 6-kinase
MSETIESWLARWRLEFEALPSRGGRSPYPGAGEVALVRRGGERLVLKLLPEGSDEFGSAAVLRHWNGVGAVRIVDEAPGAVLIERLTPGEDLCDLVRTGRDDAATHILCDVMAKLNRPAPAKLLQRSIVDWGQGFARNRGAALAVGMPADLIDQGEALFFELCASQATPIVLHGDLQHYNVLHDAVRGWLAIDPKGILGEPAYETGAMLRNPNEDLELSADSAVIARRADIMCERLGLDRERVIGWCFAQWILSILWAIQDHLDYSPAWLRGAFATKLLM